MTTGRTTDNWQRLDSHQPEVRRPQSIHPWSKPDNLDKSMWIRMTPRKIVDIFTKGRGEISIGTPEPAFVFLAPNSVGENIVHTWSPYESIQSRLADKVLSAAKLGAEVAALRSTIKRTDIEQITNTFSNSSVNFANSVEKLTEAAYSATTGSRVPKIKTDTPLYYESSERRELVFEFLLVAEKDPERDIVKPVKDLMKFSAPAISNNSNVRIEYPYLFEVISEPSGVLKMTHSVLQSVQPTWNGPYVNGYPTHVNLTLTFKDLSPLFRDTIETGSVINVVNSEVAAQRRQEGTVVPTNDLGRLSILKSPTAEAASARVRNNLGL